MRYDAVKLCVSVTLSPKGFNLVLETGIHSCLCQGEAAPVLDSDARISSRLYRKCTGAVHRRTPHATRTPILGYLRELKLHTLYYRISELRIIELSSTCV